MRSIISATLIATGMALAGPATAAPMFSFNVEDVAMGNAPTTLTTWQSGQTQYTTETFEGFESHGLGDSSTTGARNPSTPVGSFTADGKDGQGSACVEPCDTTIVKNDDDPDAAGRNATDGGSQWLDSNDAQKTIWSISGDTLPGNQFNRLAFFLTDAADVGAKVEVSLANGGNDSFDLTGLGNGNVQFITGSFTEQVTAATLTVENSSGNLTRDGWGIDDPSVAVPTPGTLALFGLGLLGLGAVGYRCRT